MDSRHSRYLEKVVNDGSALVSVQVVSGASDPAQKLPLPTEDKEPGWRLAGGADGLPAANAVVDVYKGVDDPEPSKRTAFQTFKNVDEISIVAMPGMTDQALQNEIISHCEAMKNRFGILDAAEKSDLDAVKTQRNLYDSRYAALYYPWLTIYDPTLKKNTQTPPSGYIAGVYARTDVERGVHKAPANEKLNNVIGLERVIATGQQDILNPMGINCVRVFPGRGVRVWGARTISSDSIWKYVNVRRLFIYIEESLDKGIQWVVFEPNDIPLWARVRQTVSQFLIGVWRSGALAGATPEEAFFVKCDRTTMTQDDIDNGRLICVIGVAPVKPAEFVIIRIAQWTAGAK
jgi:phage tail sheath protein FI